MILHLVNGFLGSGKTTAIIAAAKSLIEQGKTVGIVTNDKGQFQVDTSFFQTNQISTQQVTGGCFRCSFAEFEERIIQLQESTTPDVIFAESVGSCVDLVNTIFEPIQKNSRLNVDKITYSVFSDVRLFQWWVQNEPLPFSERINYLFSKQIEEGPLLILNKSDLLSPARKNEILTLAIEKFPEKMILLQNALDPGGVQPWLECLENQRTLKVQKGFVVDYPTYKGGEKEMAWLDQQFTIRSQSPAAIKPALVELITGLLSSLQKEDVFVGHVKLLLSYSESSTKISFTTADILEKSLSSAWHDLIPESGTRSITVMLNARVSMNAQDFSEMVQKATRQVENSPQIQICNLESTAYNPEMSMNHPQ